MRVMVFGTFDHLHPGHLDYFKQARRFGKDLIIVVARDRNVLKIKGRQAERKEANRARIIRQKLKKLGWTATVALGGRENRWAVIKKYHPDFICLGYDQKVDLKKLRSEIAGWRFFCKIKRLKAYQPEKYKSSYFRLK